MKRVFWGRAGSRSRGQSLVEFSFILLPILLLMTAVLEFGLVFNANLTLEYATREGARTATLVGDGAAFGIPCAPNANDSVDAQIVASVERAIAANGSITLSQVQWIHIYKPLSSTSNAEGATSIWLPGTGPKVGTMQLHFKYSDNSYDACKRSVIYPTDSVGVSIGYKHKLITPISALVNLSGGHPLFGGATVLLVDRTVMNINPAMP